MTNRGTVQRSCVTNRWSVRLVRDGWREVLRAASTQWSAGSVEMNLPPCMNADRGRAGAVRHARLWRFLQWRHAGPEAGAWVVLEMRDTHDDESRQERV